VTPPAERDLVTEADLLQLGIALADVRRLDPAPTEYVALGGSPARLVADLAELRRERGARP
jgi:hypothetical protein